MKGKRNVSVFSSAAKFSKKRQKNRKQLRKEKRIMKKTMKREYFSKKKPSSLKNSNQSDVDHNKGKVKKVVALPKANTKAELSKKKKQMKSVYQDMEEKQRKEMSKEKSLEKEMKKQRKKQLRKANEEEEKSIKQFEKLLKLNKRKSKALPRSFQDDGLAYVLEVCDNDYMKSAALNRSHLDDDSEFEDDLVAATGKSKPVSKIKAEDENKIKTDSENSFQDEDVLESETDNLSDSGESSNSDLPGEKKTSKRKDRGAADVDESSTKKKRSNNKEISDNNQSRRKSSLLLTNEENMQERVEDYGRQTRSSSIDDAERDVVISEKSGQALGKKRKRKAKTEITDETADGESSVSENATQEVKVVKKKCKKKKKKKEKEQIIEGESADDLQPQEDESGLWEDIYGRLRDKAGNIIEESKSDATSKYIPPAKRLVSDKPDAQKQEQLTKLRRQIKGLLNRLAESNLHSIATQLEELYMSNSRNNMNQCLTSLIVESVVSPALTPERLVMEHVLLLAVLHANVGTEIGAHFLQEIIKLFDLKYNAMNADDIENKELNNILLILCHLYNFKITSSLLVFDILRKLSSNFKEKDIELILLILRNVGFGLRKDDPISLKDLIQGIQERAAGAPQDNSRTQFMLDVLLAVRNNNMSKIPNYDPSHVEHLKKVLKGVLRKGCYVTEFKISVEDLLKAEERGRWWVVGSAWTGVLPGETGNEQASKTGTASLAQPAFSKELLELARRQRMNTDVRRNIFCILMSAEDYVDAFEKLLRLGLRNQQEREMVHVLIHCCLNEKEFNPYYVHIANKLCTFDRKFQLAFQFSFWDRFKELSSLGSQKLTNLAKFVAHLCIEGGLPLSVLKVLPFAELDKTGVRFLRQLLLTLLLMPDADDTTQKVFRRVAASPKLNLLRDGLRLFMHHFLLKRIDSNESDVDKLRARIALAEQSLETADSRLRL